MRPTSLPSSQAATARGALSRRDMLGVLLSAGAAVAVPGLAHAATVAGATQGTAADARLAQLLADFADEILLLSPSYATSLGLDTGARAGLKSQLEDYSPGGDAQWAKQVASMSQRLATLGRNGLGQDARIRHDAVRYSIEAGMAGTRFEYGGAASGFFGSASPYPVTQQGGAIASMGEFLHAQHQIKDVGDADAYLARLAALARVLDQETARIADQAGKGTVPPDFIARAALVQLQAFRDTPVAQQQLVISLTQRTARLGLAGDWQARASKLFNSSVYPALERQIAALARASVKAGAAPGIDRVPDGKAYYQWALNLGTSTTFNASEIHALGLAQLGELQARIDLLLRAQGLSQGTVGQRMNAMARDPKLMFPDNDAGRAQLIAYCNDRVAAIRKLMPKLSHLRMKAPLEIRRVPEEIQAGAGLGYMSFASLDGERPAIYYINLKSTAYWPKPVLATLTAHEGLPGHAWQGAYMAEHQGKLPLIASLTSYNAFIEGWGLYAEQLVDECGLYAGDPLSQIGYLHGLLFRTCRLVVDTGLHAMQWSRQQAIQFLLDNVGGSPAGMTSEVDRYTVTPGQACGYKMGHNEIVRQRQRAQAALGARFDLAGYNDALVSSTGVPLTVLPTVVDHFIAASR